MQTILKVVRGNGGQGNMVHNYLTQYCARIESDAQSTEPVCSDAGEVAFVKDDAYEFRNESAEQEGLLLGSLRPMPNQAKSKTRLIFMNPMILLYRPNGQNLRLWVATASSGAAESSESE
jgi:hypothetical protein